MCMQVGGAHAGRIYTLVETLSCMRVWYVHAHASLGVPWYPSKAPARLITHVLYVRRPALRLRYLCPLVCHYIPCPRAGACPLPVGTTLGESKEYDFFPYGADIRENYRGAENSTWSVLLWKPGCCHRRRHRGMLRC